MFRPSLRCSIKRICLVIFSNTIGWLIQLSHNLLCCIFNHGTSVISLLQFCQPGGWELTERRQEPTYFVSVLTDIDGERHYCACLTFYEPYDDQRSESSENLEALGDGIVHHSMMFAPKSIVLISQLDYFDTFKVCILYDCELSSVRFWLSQLMCKSSFYL